MPRVVVLGRIAKVEEPLNDPAKFTSSPVKAVAPNPLAVLANAIVPVPEDKDNA